MLKIIRHQRSLVIGIFHSDALALVTHLQSFGRNHNRLRLSCVYSKAKNKLHGYTYILINLIYIFTI